MIFKFIDAEFLLRYALSARPRKSQQEPEINTGPVKVAVSSNFDTIVTNSGRDAFILFYKPTCPHCQKLEPTWEEFAVMMKDEAVDIIQIDAVANRILAPYEVTKYPTIYMKFADATKRPIKYTDERSIRAFLKFVCKHATHELSGWNRKGRTKK